MRNQYPGTCYSCDKTVDIGKGHFERHKGKWRTIHAECVFKQRSQKVVASGFIQEGDNHANKPNG